MSKRANPFLTGWLVAGFAFLYIPILSLILFSFNESKLVTVWAGFSTRWYKSLLENQQILDAAHIRLQTFDAVGAEAIAAAAE